MTPATMPQHTLFLSHSSKDSNDARRLAIDLRKLGVSVWIDSFEMKAGNRIVSELEAALNACTHFAVWLTQNAIDSEWVQREVDAAHHLFRKQDSRYMIPLLAEDGVTLPVFLLDVSAADFRQDYRRGLNQLLDILPDGELNSPELCVDQAKEMLRDLTRVQIVFPLHQPIGLERIS